MPVTKFVTGDAISVTLAVPAQVVGGTVILRPENFTAPGASPVQSVFGRIGNVVALNGDYLASQVTNNSSVAGATVADALDSLFNNPGTLAQTLATGNTTGANNIIISTGQSLLGATDLPLSPGAGVGDQVVLDGLRWPGSDGGANTYLKTDGAGNLSFSSVPADTLATTLAAGNSTGSNNIIVTTGQQIQGQTNLTLNPGAGGGDKVVIDGLSWPTADGGANTYLKTDGAGNLSFSSVPSDTLSSVLAAGNTTGANNIVVSAGQSITGATDLTLSPGAGIGDRVVLDGLRWPGADGAPSTYLQTNGAGVLTFAAVPADTLAAVLAAGNTTGANNLIVSTSQEIQGQTDLLLNPGASPFDRVQIDGLWWPFADGSPNQFLSTDGSGTLSFATPAVETLSDTLAAGNTTGANDVIIDTSQAVRGATNLLLSGGQTTGAGSPASATLATNATSAGGPVTIAAGTGSGGAGGAVTVTSGGTNSGSGGQLDIQSGQGSSGFAGVVLIHSGTSSVPTAVSLISGASSSATGQIRLYANTLTHTGGGLLLGRGTEITNQGGYSLLMGGTGSGGGSIGGQAAVLGGLANTGGLVTVLGGTGSSGAGGAILVQGGTGSTTGGNMTIQGGTGTTTGGTITLQGGTGNPGATVAVLGGNATGGSGGNGGSVSVRPGTPDGGGTVGTVQIGPNSGTAGRIQANGSLQKGTGIQCGSITINAGASNTTVSFNPTMASSPIVTITPVFGTGPLVADFWIDTIGTSSFVIRRSATTDGAVLVHWMAMSTP